MITLKNISVCGLLVLLSLPLASPAAVARQTDHGGFGDSLFSHKAPPALTGDRATGTATLTPEPDAAAAAAIEPAAGDAAAKPNVEDVVIPDYDAPVARKGH